MAGLTGSLSALVLILCGALNALLSKVVYQLEGQDCSGQTKQFEKPWLQTALMFVAMAVCLPIQWGIEKWQQKHPKHPGKTDDGDSAQEPLLPNGEQQQQSGHDGGPVNQSQDKFNLKEALLLCIPTGFDLAATTLMNVGLLYVAASVFQILRGAEMVFAALFAVTFLKRPLNRWHYGGVALCMVGITLVGVSRVLAGGDEGDGGGGGGDNSSVDQLGGPGGASDPKKAALGMALILLSQAIQAGQVTVEDHFMADMHIHPLKIVGWEGVIGTIVMCAGALPILQVLPYPDGSGLAEDTKGSWCMARSSPTIAVTVTVSSLAVLVYNISGMYVTDQVGAAARTVLENARTLIVWLAALGLYYTHVGGGKVGEAWDSWSWLQAVGFAVFAAGAFCYDKGHRVQEEEDEQAGRVPKYSKWAVLKSTLGIHTGHFVGIRKFRAVGTAVLAGVRAQRLARANNGDEHA